MGHTLSTGTALSRIDPTVVAELRSVGTPGSADLYCRLAELFRNKSPDTLMQLRTALAAEDLQVARAICHKLKSAAANVGALAFSREVNRLEQLCAHADVARAQVVFASLAAAHTSLLAALSGS